MIGLASLGKTLALRGGGGKVALELGGSLVDPDTRDPLKRRLVNVVEEIALASGVPVPEVYVLEQESGINAFAAGYSPADAAIAVTRGTLEKLSRAELQGVIAHEFSHVFNGDMRLNIRLMGALFGILLLAIIGRRVLVHSHFMGRSRDRNGAAILALAVTLMLVGYIGLFFGRWIKAAVSRQREYLADASAVQFTRDPDGIAGALKKIAVYSDASYLQADTEEVGHMLFGQGRAAHIFATHPPLAERIARIEPGFQASDLDRFRAELERDRIREARAEQRAAQREPSRRDGFLDADSLIDAIGNPDFNRLLLAAGLAASLPAAVNRAAHDLEEAPAVLAYSLLHGETASQEAQLLAIAETMGADLEEKVRNLAQAAGVPAPEQRLPLLEMALPGLRRHPPATVQNLLLAVDRMVRVDGEIEVFEYLMVRTIRQYLWESTNPHTVRVSGRKILNKLEKEVRNVIAIIASHGHPDDPQAAARAYRDGMAEAFGASTGEMPRTGDWIATMDHALDRLDNLSSADKQRLVRALVTTVAADDRLAPGELELMRVVCGALHVPIPALVSRRP